MTTAPESKALTPVEKGQALLKTGKTITLSDLVAEVAPTAPAATPPAKIPAAREITAEQKAAIARIPKVYGQVVPVERRALTQTEVDLLIDERETLDQVKKVAEARLKDITLTVHNHLDVKIEEAVEASAEGGPEVVLPPRDEHGHYVSAGRVGVPAHENEFSREVRQYAATLDIDALAALDTGEPDALLTHEEYLSMTRQVRVVDENLVMVALRKNPALVKALAAAVKPGGQSTSVYLRKRK